MVEVEAVNDIEAVLNADWDSDAVLTSASEVEPETVCCRAAMSSGGWRHDEDCENWTFCY